MAKMSSTWLHRYAVVLAVSTLFLVIAGASVTSNEAGLSVPDWPLSYGQVMPEMTGGVFYEHGHRMIASTVGFLTIVLALWVWRADSRRWMHRLGFAALLAVIVQGVLGGMTVLFLLPPAVSISHACLAQLFFSTTVAIAIFTSASWRQGPVPVEDTGWPSIRHLAFTMSGLVLLQVALGAAFRHKVLSVVPHVVGAILVTVFILMVATFVLTQFQRQPALRRTAWALIGITCLQVLFGIAAYLLRITAIGPPALPLIVSTVTHVATGALTLAASIALTIQVCYHVRPRAERLTHEQLNTVSG